MYLLTLPLLLPLLSASPLITPTNSTTGPLTIRPVHCFPPQPYLHPTTLDDCTYALIVLRHIDNFHDVRKWNLTSRRSWSSTTAKCDILLWSLVPGAEDEFAPALVAQRAQQVIQRCVGQEDERVPPTFGGKVAVGGREVFEVVVLGKGRGGEVEVG